MKSGCRGLNSRPGHLIFPVLVLFLLLLLLLCSFVFVAGVTSDPEFSLNLKINNFISFTTFYQDDRCTFSLSDTLGKRLKSVSSQKESNLPLSYSRLVGAGGSCEDH